MKILLIYPPTNRKVVGGDMLFLHEPLALEYLGAAVKDHHDVQILDMRVNDRLGEVLESFSPDLVGITGFTIHVNSVKSVLRQVKEHDRGILTVIGGPHVSYMPEDFFDDPVDVMVLGEGVLPFREVVARFEKKQDLAGIPGTAVREDGLFRRTAPDPHPGLDALPLPARILTRSFRDRYFTPLMKPLAMIKSSIGCHYRCNYCVLWKVTDGRFMPRDPRRVALELASIEEPNVFFGDDDTLVDPERMSRLADVIKSEGIGKNYQINGRADTIVRRPDLIEKWRKIGLTSVVMGFESYRDEDLRYFNRGTDVSTNEKALGILRQNGVTPHGYFIVRPDYDRENFRALRDYIRRLGLTYLIFTVLTPIPGTEYYEEAKSRILKNDYDLYDFRHSLLPTKLPLDDFYRQLAMLWEESVPRWKGVVRLLSQPIGEIIPRHLKSKKVIRQIRNSYRDY